jgi:hypothetical protein
MVKSKDCAGSALTIGAMPCLALLTELWHRKQAKVLAALWQQLLTVFSRQHE